MIQAIANYDHTYATYRLIPTRFIYEVSAIANYKYRLYNEVEVCNVIYTPEARGCVNRVETDTE